MKIIDVSQTEDRENWLELRRTVVTSSKAKGIRPLTRGTDRTPAGFWELLAENLAVAKDGEPEKDRGHRLQAEAIKELAKRYKLKFNTDAGFWIDEKNPKIGISPDGAEPGDKPTYAAEVKALDSKNHLEAIVKDLRAKKEDEYNPLNSLLVNPRADFRYQATQYFIVNEHLKTLYVVFYDDRIALDNLVTYVIKIKRKDVEEQAKEQREIEEDAVVKVKELIEELKNV